MAADVMAPPAPSPTQREVATIRDACPWNALITAEAHVTAQIVYGACDALAAIVEAFGPLFEQHVAAVADTSIIEIATVDHADRANALLAVGWVLLGVAAHREAAPEFHLGRPAHVPEVVR